MPSPRRRLVASSIAHYVAGVLDHQSLADLINDLWFVSDLAPGDSVQTLRGSLTGKVIEIFPDGRVRWETSTGGELIATAVSLVKIK